MPAAKQRARASSSSSRGRASSNGSSGSSRSSGASRQRSRPTAAKRTTGNGSAAKRAASSATQAASNGHSQGDHGKIATLGMSAAAATIGVAGGVLLGRTALQRNRKVLGVKLPVKVDLSDVTKQVGEAGKQFGKLAGEVRAVRQKAEQVGRAIS